MAKQLILFYGRINSKFSLRTPLNHELPEDVSEQVIFDRYQIEE